jgi:hypothetical protein
MIDWDLTKAKFGDVDLSQFRPRVIVRCDKCNKESIFTIRVKSRLKNSQLSWLCYKCACNKGDVKKTHSKQMSAQWENQIYYNERSNSSKELWRGDDFKKCHHEAVQEQDSRQKCSDAARLAWQNPDYREKHAVALAKQLIRTPNTEKRVRQILTDLGVQFDTNVVVGPYTFDIGVKRENKPYLLLEVNGNYWHTRPYVMRKDAAKADYISKFQQYELKTVWEHQLFDIIKVKQLLSRFVGNEIPQFVRLDLSQINYSTITDRKQLNEFFGNYHYLGSAGRCGMAVGGFYNEQLICAAIFAHPTRKESYINICSSKEVYELTRFLIHPSYHIPNLASHFLSICRS